MKSYDILIIGGGAAGLSSAIYCSRGNVNVLVVEKDKIGGKLNLTNSVENYAGVDNQSGFEISNTLLKQSKDFGTNFLFDEVIDIENIEENIKTVIFKKSEPIQTKAIIVASGSNSIDPIIENYKTLFGKGISKCLICDGNFFKGKNIAVFGNGNSALEETLFASKVVNKIFFINPNEELRAFSYIKSDFERIKNLELFNNHSISKIIGKEKLESIIIKDIKTNKEKEIKLEGLFYYLGWKPGVTFLKNKINLGKFDYIKIDPLTGETNIRGIFAAGDIVEKKYRQLTGAVSDGTNAALSSMKYIESL